MNVVSIFLGSSASLIKSVRNPLGHHINKLCSRWLDSGVRIRLNIWEDYNSAYRGHSKQNDYIDDLVLPSDLAVFIADDGIHEYTQKELDAKYEQDNTAIHCFVIPCKDGFHDDVYTSLSEKYDNVYKANNLTEICDKLDSVVADYIKQNSLESERPTGLIEKWFYTTIPNDVDQYRNQIGTYIRKLDDISMDDWGIHCALHEQKKPDLLDESDHYIPIFKRETSVEDINEFKAGIEKTEDPTKRLECLTLFNAGNIYKNNQEVHKLIGDGRDCFPRKFYSMDSLIAELSNWLRYYKKTLVLPSDISTEHGKVSFKGKEFAPVVAFDASGKLEVASKKADYARNKLRMAINRNVLNDKAITLELTKDQANATLLYQINDIFNSWANELSKIADKSKDEATEIEALDAEIVDIITCQIKPELATKLVDILRRKEKIIEKHVSEETVSPYMLLSTRLQHIALFDTYLKRNNNQQDEDELYKRLVDGADSVGIKSGIVEMMRMNFANSLSRREDPSCVEIYETTLSNLNSLYDGSVTISQYISIVFMHLCMCQIERNDIEGANRTISQFEEHIKRLDETEVRFLADRCMYSTCKINLISIHDSSQHEVVSEALDLYNEAVESLYMAPSDDMFEDVYIYMPNMIARYYIDHLGQFGLEKFPSIIDRINGLLKKAKEQCKKLCEWDYLNGVFYLSELYHQEGFFYSMFPKHYIEGIECYNEALSSRRWIFNTTKDSSSEPLIAQTLVNLGALELDAIRVKIMDLEFTPIEKAQEAMEIYSRHRSEESALYELEYYEALQLRGTIRWYIRGSDPDNEDTKECAIDDLKQCWEWNKQHFPNEYSRKFLDYSGEILLSIDAISHEEFRELNDRL